MQNFFAKILDKAQNLWYNYWTHSAGFGNLHNMVGMVESGEKICTLVL